MTTAREEILRRVRSALDTASPDPRPVTVVARQYRRAGASAEGDPVAGDPAAGDPAAGDSAAGDLAELLSDRLIDYRANVVRCAQSEAAAHIAALCAARGLIDLAVPGGFPVSLLTDVTARCVPADGLGTFELDGIGGTISLCATAIAETGTIVLDAGPGQGPRALSLIPDYLLLVVGEEQIVPGVPDGVAALDPSRPLTWISGPSATSDIELQRVEGVHGPRVLDVVLMR